MAGKGERIFHRATLRLLARWKTRTEEKRGKNAARRVESFDQDGDRVSGVAMEEKERCIFTRVDFEMN
ncbi:hypothetical protein WN55_02933 [Dufourea novaeangliae]|uniref:Uncharacterized protein n=1 Tax=Dufourea novaeangliae TaxID=178035 RepID=A0A154PIG6_DUFNO|nr:hypothetical protein WN55_02933 [Dufourea novaeangliae]